MKRFLFISAIALLGVFLSAGPSDAGVTKAVTYQDATISTPAGQIDEPLVVSFDDYTSIEWTGEVVDNFVFSALLPSEVSLDEVDHPPDAVAILIRRPLRPLTSRFKYYLRC